MKQTFGKIPRSLIALETGTHSPWVSRMLTELGHEVLVAHAQKVQLITKSNRKDDQQRCCADTGATWRESIPSWRWGRCAIAVRRRKFI